MFETFLLYTGSGLALVSFLLVMVLLFDLRQVDRKANINRDYIIDNGNKIAQVNANVDFMLHGKPQPEETRH